MKQNVKKKTVYLSYIEETKVHFDTLKFVAEKATKKAYMLTKERKLPITFKLGNKIVREFSDGRQEVLETLKATTIKVKEGATRQLY